MIDELRRIFLQSLQEFLTLETDNILNGVSERNLCGRLAIVLERRARAENLNGYYADVEYNRNEGGRIKTIIDGNMKIIPITCDLILHSRGAIIEKDNLIAIEMKKKKLSEVEKNKDRNRLVALTKISYDDIWSYDGKTLPEHVCGYEIGYFLELSPEERWILIFEYIAGKQNHKTRINF